MKRIFSHPVTALAAGLCLRLYFVLRFPANSGDTVLYEQMAVNWLKQGTYAMEVGGVIQAVDLRMPGYPAYLALVYWLTGRTGEAARLWVMLGQVAVDLLACVAIAFFAGAIAFLTGSVRSRRAAIAALWLSTICPFIANYTAVPLTEVFATALTGTATLFIAVFLSWVISGLELGIGSPLRGPGMAKFLTKHAGTLAWITAGLIAGLATLFRPEGPLILMTVWMMGVAVGIRKRSLTEWLRGVVVSGAACGLMLAPWAVRNYVTLHEVQFLAPKNSNLPGELVPYGFMAWEKTWLFRVRDCYLVPWKLNGEAIDVEQIPARAFDTPEEKWRVAMILEAYNEDLTLDQVEDNAFAQLARERTARHPLRTYVWLPALRAMTIWFSPRIELLPVSGTVFPLVQSWNDDKVDQGVTVGLFLLNIFYVGLAIWGGWRLWRSGPNAQPAVVFLLLFIAVRTAFLTTLETPEPRYVLECFPALIALGAQAAAFPARLYRSRGRISITEAGG